MKCNRSLLSRPAGFAGLMLRKDSFVDGTL